MKHIVFFSDIHLGLVTSDIDRTEEIVQVSLQAVKHAVKLRKSGKEVSIVCGGDVFNHNDPSEYLIGQFIRIMNLAVKHEIPFIVMVGNHDSISKVKRKSCLEFIRHLKGDYKKWVELIDDIKTCKWFDGDIGSTHITFLPHITRAHLHETKYKSTQEYIDTKAKRALKAVGPGQHHIVFSHLNVKGIIPGSEENLLKKSEVYIPDCLFFTGERPDGILSPRIVQAHIHTKQDHENVHVVGSQFWVDFGEKEKKKYFAVVNVPETFGEKDSIDYIQTKCRSFIEIDLEVDVSFQMDSIKPYKKKIKPNSVVKINVTTTPSCSEDWEAIRVKVEKKYNCVVKPITPKIIKERVVRNKQQSIKLNPSDAVVTWMKKNKPKGRKRKLRLAKDYIEKHL